MGRDGGGVRAGQTVSVRPAGGGRAFRAKVRGVTAKGRVQLTRTGGANRGQNLTVPASRIVG